MSVRAEQVRTWKPSVVDSAKSNHKIEMKVRCIVKEYDNDILKAESSLNIKCGEQGNDDRGRERMVSSRFGKESVVVGVRNNAPN